MIDRTLYISVPLTDYPRPVKGSLEIEGIFPFSATFLCLEFRNCIPQNTSHACNYVTVTCVVASAQTSTKPKIFGS